MILTSPLSQTSLWKKPHIIHALSPDSNLLHKRGYKFIHNLKLSKEVDLHPRTSAKIKILFCLDLNRNLPKYPIIPLKTSRIKKFIKLRQRYLKALDGELQLQPRFLSLLPRLKQINLNHDSGLWRIFTTRFNFQDFSINFQKHRIPSYSKRFSQIDQLLKDYTGSFLRSLYKQRSLQNLDITLYQGNNSEIQIIQNLLNKIDFSTVRLKHFCLTYHSTGEWGIQVPFPIGLGVKKALGYVQKLTLHDTICFISLFDGNVLKNLSALEVKMCPRNASLNMLSTLRKITTLKDIKMTFQATSVEHEEKFLEFFRLPSNIQSVDLTLVNFQWNWGYLTKINRKKLLQEFDNHQRFSFFFAHWKELKHVKNFSLALREESEQRKRCPGLAADFASRIIKQLGGLINIHYQHYLSPIDLPKKRKKKPVTHEKLAVKSLNLDEFWKALEPSKNTLQNLTIDAPEIAFPLKMSSLNSQFPRLEKIFLGGRILWAKDLSYFWNEFKSLKQMKIGELSFPDEKKLEAFLNAFLNTLPNAPKGFFGGGFKLNLQQLQAKSCDDLDKFKATLENINNMVKLEMQFFERYKKKYHPFWKFSFKIRERWGIRPEDMYQKPPCLLIIEKFEVHL